MNYSKTYMSFFCSAGLLIAQSASAAVLLNGDFSTDADPTITPSATNPVGNLSSGNSFDSGEQNTGWVGSRNGWTISGGVATRDDDNTNDQPLVQVASVPNTLTGNQYNLTFDWTPAAGATGAALDLTVIVAGYIQGSDPIPAGRAFFDGINFSTDEIRPVGGTGSSFVDLFDGSSSTGNSDADQFVFTGTDGMATTAEFTLDFGTNNIEDFDFLGLRFEVGDNTSIGGVLDNVSFNAIPEPSSTLLLGLGALGFMGRKRN